MLRLPDDVKTSFEKLNAGETYSDVVRSLNDINGKLGECYLINGGSSLFVFSKRVGSALKSFDLAYADIEEMAISEDGPFCQLHLYIDAHQYDLKFANMDKKALDNLLAAWEQAGSEDNSAGSSPAPIAVKAQTHEGNATDETDDNLKFTALIGFSAAIYGMVQADGVVDKVEMDKFNHLIDDGIVVMHGLEYLRQYGTTRLIEKIDKDFNYRQKLCLIANLIDMALADNVIRDSEMDLLQQFKDNLHIKDDDFTTILEVMTIKDDLRILDE